MMSPPITLYWVWVRVMAGTGIWGFPAGMAMHETSRNNLAVRYRFALGLSAVLSVAACSILYRNSGAQQTNAAVVNASGRHCMLSPREVKLFMIASCIQARV